MMWIAIAAYFVLACLLAALLLLPTFRDAALQRVMDASRRVAGARSGAHRAAARHAQDGYERAISGTRWLQRNALRLLVALGLLAIPPLIVFSLRAWHTLDAYDDTTTTTQPDSVIAALLQGEQLVPPPPLPPEVFTTAEVAQVRPQLGTADRRWEVLDAEFRQRLLLAYRLMREEHGYEMVLLEGYRSAERQNFLAGLGVHVTNAVAWQSFHQHGLAADSAFLREGKLIISERDPWAARGYELYGHVAQRVGLTWGGRWQNTDLGHVELRRAGVSRPKVGA